MSSASDHSLGDPEAIRRLLSQPETRTVLAALKARDPEQVRAAARSALAGDAGGLEGLLRALSRDHEAKKAMERLERSAR